MHAKASIVVEEYLKIIYSLSLEQKNVRAVSLTNRLKSSASTVSATLSRLQRDGLIELSVKKDISLTSEGLKSAEAIVRRHRLVETFLCTTLKINWYEVHQHAHVLEHGLTPLVEEKLAEFLGFPESCPHGAPIPGFRNSLPSEMIYLDAAQKGSQIEIVMIDSSLEDSKDLLKFLQEKDLLPGKKHLVIDRREVTKTVLLKYSGESVAIPFEIASKIGVIPLA